MSWGTSKLYYCNSSPTCIAILFSYAANAKRMSRMIAKKPMKPRETLIKYAEFAAEFGNLPHLDPVGRKMPFYKLYLLDIIIPLLLLIMLLFAAVLFAIYKIVIVTLRHITVTKNKTE